MPVIRLRLIMKKIIPGKSLVKLVLCCSLCLPMLLHSSVLPAQPAANHRLGLEGRIMAFLQLSMETEDMKGLSVGFVGPGGFSWAAGLGHSSLEEQQPASQYTLYPVASLTKLFTTIAIMQLLEEGSVCLDDPLQKYLPDFTIRSRFADADAIRIRHLLSHYAGVPRDLYKGLMTSDPSERPDLLEYLSGQYVAYPPGVKYLYSNLGYELLGLLLEEVTGVAYELYVERHILQPLGMEDSGFFSDAARIAGLSEAYIRGDEQAYSEFPGTLGASGGLYSTAADMSRAMLWILGGKQDLSLVGEYLLEQMLSDQKTKESLDVGLMTGWSWVLEEHPEPMEGQYAYQIGSTLHYHAVMALAPEHDMGVVLLSNTGGTLAALEEMARLVIQVAIQDQSGRSFPEQSPRQQAPLAEAQPGEMERITGHYLLQNELIRLSVVNGELVLRTGEQNYRTFYHEDGWFSLHENFRFTSLLWDDRKVLLVERNGRVFPAGTDISEGYVLPEDVFEILGSYCLANVDPEIEELMYDKARLSLEGPVLHLSLRLSEHQQRIFGYDQAGFNLIPMTPGEAVIAGFGMYKGETVFWGKDDGEPYLSFAGLQFRRCKP